MHDTLTIAKDLYFPVQRRDRFNSSRTPCARRGARGNSHLRPHLVRASRMLSSASDPEHVSSEHPLALPPPPAGCLRRMDSQGALRMSSVRRHGFGRRLVLMVRSGQKQLTSRLQGWSGYRVAASAMAVSLSPTARRVCGVGPIKLSPACSIHSAKSALSAKKPYPDRPASM